MPPSDVLLEPVNTRLFTEDNNPVQAMKEYVTQPMPGDVATLSSCVAGLMEGRIFMEGAVEPGFLARTLSRFVDQKDIPFGGAAPMANPLSMQVLLEEIGSVRTLVAAAAGALGKLCLLYTSIFTGNSYVEPAFLQRQEGVSVTLARGRIMDRNEIPLHSPCWNPAVAVFPTQVTVKEDFAKEAALATGLTETWLESVLDLSLIHI